MDFSKVISEIPQLSRGQVWCRSCGSTRRVNSSEAMRNGWPKCCSMTMTIDSPDKQQQKTEVVAEYIFRDMPSGEFWIDISVNRQPYGKLGPFDTETERQKAHDDLLNMTRSLGAKDLPSLPQ